MVAQARKAGLLLPFVPGHRRRENHEAHEEHEAWKKAACEVNRAERFSNEP